jgi:hypothetical protein
MHFLIGFAISSDVEQHRWERRWYGCGRKQDSTDEIGRAWMAACGDRSDVPQDWQTGIEIGGLDQQQSSFLVFRGDLREHLFLEIV